MLAQRRAVRDWTTIHVELFDYCAECAYSKGKQIQKKGNKFSDVAEKSM
jgi:hypothetical protein